MQKFKYIFFARVVKHDIIKHFAAFGSVLFFLAQKGENHAFLLKNGLTSCQL